MATILLSLKRQKSLRKNGFTLIELSVVLVIIGLVIGAILVGQDVIKSAEIRAQLSQIERYNTAVNTFYSKYGQLPGDMQAAYATQFGFYPRTGGIGSGDGNGELDGNDVLGTGYSWNENGENLLIWQDLSVAGLIGETFTKTSGYVDDSVVDCTAQASSYVPCIAYFPQAKISGNNYITTYSGYASKYVSSQYVNFGPNFFEISSISTMVISSFWSVWGSVVTPGLTARQAYDMDRKIDDGIPTNGQILAQYLDNSTGHPVWSTNSSSESSTTCYDTSSGSPKYSISNGGSVSNGGNTFVCGLSFQFQAGTTPDR